MQQYTADRRQRQTSGLKRRAWTYGIIAVLAVLAHTLDFVIEVAIMGRTSALALAVIFILRYAVRPWRQTHEGEHVMTLTFIIAGFMAYATVNNVMTYLDPATPPVDGDYPGRAMIGLILYAAVAWELWERNHLLTLADHEDV